MRWSSLFLDIVLKAKLLPVSQTRKSYLDLARALVVGNRVRACTLDEVYVLLQVLDVLPGTLSHYPRVNKVQASLLLASDNPVLFSALIDRYEYATIYELVYDLLNTRLTYSKSSRNTLTHYAVGLYHVLIVLVISICQI